MNICVIWTVFILALTQIRVHLFGSWNPGFGIRSRMQMMNSCCCSMADWYMKAAQEGESEQSRLARILDLAQDLKVRGATAF